MDIRDVLIELMLERFYKDFAATSATKVIELDGVGELYSIATDNALALPKTQKQNVIFRSAYTLEYIYFNNPDLFIPFREKFISDFNLCQNSSAKRHFAKMMADLLKYHTPTMEQIESIAETAVSWIAEPKTRVAVKLWSMSILKIIRQKVSWLDDIWEDLEAVMINNTSPAIEVRFRRGW